MTTKNRLGGCCGMKLALAILRSGKNNIGARSPKLELLESGLVKVDAR